MIHYSFLAELASRPAAVYRPKQPPETVIHENILFDPKMRNIKFNKDLFPLPWLNITNNDKKQKGNK